MPNINSSTVENSQTIILWKLNVKLSNSLYQNQLGLEPSVANNNPYISNLKPYLTDSQFNLIPEELNSEKIKKK